MLRPMALVLPMLGSILFALVGVSSLSLSPTDVQSGAASTATVTLDATPPPVGVRVNLSSSNPSVATVPAFVTIGPLKTRTISVKSVQGAAGCTTISAKAAKSTTARSAQLFVLPPTSISPVTLTLSKSSIAGGASLTGRVVVAEPSAIGAVVQLSSSNPSVTVPASVTLQPNEIGVAEATFNISTAVVAPSTCSVIAATYQGSKASRKLLKVFTISG